jgi:hypothetical protein
MSMVHFSQNHMYFGLCHLTPDFFSYIVSQNPIHIKIMC